MCSGSECEQLVDRLSTWTTDDWTHDRVQYEMMEVRKAVHSQSEPGWASYEKMVAWREQDRRMWKALDTAKERYTQPHRYPHSEFIAAVALDQARYDREGAAREERKQRPWFTQSLSSIQRPPQPISPAAATDLLSLLDSHTCHLMLSFLSSKDFFLLFPRLSRATQYAFTHPLLHQLYGQSRLAMTDRQWALFGSQSWAVLTRPVWKEGYYLYEHRLKQMQKAEDCQMRDRRACLQPHYPHLSPYSSDIIQHSIPPPLSSPSDSTQPTASHLPVVSSSSKDWCMESVHLHQLLVFATVFLTRRAPNVTSSGRPIRYILPAVLRALIIDRVTAQEVISIVSDSATPRTYAECSNIKHRLLMGETFLYLDHLAPFPERVSAVDTVTLPTITPPNSVRPSTAMESAAVTTLQQRQQAAAAAAVERQSDEQPLVERLLANGHCDALDECIELTEPLLCQPHTWIRVSYGLWFGEQLRRTIDDAQRDEPTATASTSTRPIALPLSSTAAVIVDLEHCPIIRTELNRDNSEPEDSTRGVRSEVVALSANEWCECGGVRFDENGAMWREDTDRVALWLGLHTQLTDEQQQRVTAGDEWRNRWHQLKYGSGSTSGESSEFSPGYDSIVAASKAAAAHRVFDVRYPHIPRYRYQPSPLDYTDMRNPQPAQPDIEQTHRQRYIDSQQRWEQYRARVNYRLLQQQKASEEEKKDEEEEEKEKEEEQRSPAESGQSQSHC